jgi:hypothetical protein
MKFITKVVICIAGLCCTTNSVLAQGSKKNAAATIITADSLVSGNTKDVLTNFFQLAFNDLTGIKRELNFNSNVFAIMLKSNPKLDLDENYGKCRALRKLNIGVGLKLDSSYHFNGFSSGVKYAIIDQRDSTTSKMLFRQLKINGFLDERTVLNRELVAMANTLFPNAGTDDDEFKGKAGFRDTIAIFFNQKVPFNKLNSRFKDLVRQIVVKEDLQQIKSLFNADSTASLKSNDIKIFDSLKNEIRNSLLWTVGVSDTTYKDHFFLSNLLLNTEITKGIGHPKPGTNNIEFNAKLGFNFLRDTLQAGDNLKRLIMNAEGGFNWVIRNSEKSIFEFKASFTYYSNLSSLYTGEKRNSKTFNGTLRLRVYEDIWVPLELKYDPDVKHLFGFLNVKANFSGLGKLLKEGAL